MAPLFRGLLIWLLCSSAESTSCPIGSFYVLRGKCLTFYPIGAPHDAAEAYCQKAFPGGHLATYTSKSEHVKMLNFITKEVNTAPLRGQHLWFGMDMHSGGSMTTEGFVNSYLPWTNDAYKSYPSKFPELRCVVISSFNSGPDTKGVNQYQKGLILRSQCSNPFAYACSFNAGLPKGISAHFQSFDGRLDVYHLLAKTDLLRDGDCRVKCLLHVQCHSYSFHRGAVTLNKSCLLYWLGTTNNAAFSNETDWSHGVVLGHRSFDYS